MTDANDMVHITQGKLEKLVRKYAPRICKPKETVIREDRPQPHSPRMQYGLMAQTTKTGMAVYDADVFANDDVSEYGKEGEDGRKGGFAVYDPEGDVVDFQAVGQVANASPASVGVCYDDYFVAAVD